MGSSSSKPSPKLTPSLVLRNLLSLRRRRDLGSSDDPLHPRDVITLTHAMEFIVLSSSSSSKHYKQYHQQQQQQRVQRQYIQAKRLYDRMSPGQRKSLRHQEPVKKKPRSYAQLLEEIKKECNIILHGLPPLIFVQHTSTKEILFIKEIQKQVFIRNLLLPIVSQKFHSLDSDVQSLLSSILPPTPPSPYPPGV